MSVFLNALEQFHFIRPWLLLLLPVVVGVWWLVRRPSSASEGGITAQIAPHLAKALTVGDETRRRVYPVDGVALALVLALLGAAGPTWSRVPNPLVSDIAPLVVVLKVSKSMEQTDLPPSRLERARHKILDLVERRSGAKTGLIAYAGTAHKVVPLTEDPDVIKPFLEGLSPDVMPRDGANATAALTLARETLEGREVGGSIVFVLDELDPVDLPAFRQNVEENGPGIVFWIATAAGANQDTLGAVPNASAVTITPNKADIDTIERRIASAYRDAAANDDRLAWEDRGWIFAWPAAFLTLFWFRRGWTMRWMAIIALSGLFLDTGSAQAQGWKDWFLTKDQQARLAFEDRDFSKAADLFEDPLWKGYALFRAGRYEEASDVYTRLPGADAAFGEGMSLIRSRSYREAIAAFDKALERAPDFPGAQHNLDLARYILDYLETAREQSDTGENSGIGADDIVYDNQSGRGEETTREYGQSEVRVETAEQWMRTVDTRTSDFLRSRFALETARRGE
ncbi:VWA domain-containing protein [Roseibium sp.]|uniref:VWA domain-containing protein n=1 Tax=Roseibium sp. TaxID=1936156 RepID=UPI003A96CD44